MRFLKHLGDLAQTTGRVEPIRIIESLSQRPFSNFAQPDQNDLIPDFELPFLISIKTDFSPTLRSLQFNVDRWSVWWGDLSDPKQCDRLEAQISCLSSLEVLYLPFVLRRYPSTLTELQLECDRIDRQFDPWPPIIALDNLIALTLMRPERNSESIQTQLPRVECTKLEILCVSNFYEDSTTTYYTSILLKRCQNLASGQSGL
jgi:hypothetical protein